MEYSKRNMKYAAYAMLPVMAFAFVGVGAVSAHSMGMFGFGRSATPEQIAEAQTDMFTRQAGLLGLSVDAVKQAWAEGKTLQELATANGITSEQLKQKMVDARKQQMKDDLATLVSKGVITQAQADQRLSFMEKQMTNEKSGKRGGHGFGHFGPRF